MHRVIVLAGIALLIRSSVVPAQTPNAPSVSFEAASIKPNLSGESNTSVRRLPGGRFTATNVPVALLVQMAHQLQLFQMQGVPAWLRTDRFDIVAKLEGDPPPPPVGSTLSDPMMLALQAMLADRFKLSAHWETPELPVYALVLARADRKLGPSIRPAAVDCDAAAAASAAAAKEGRNVSPNTPDRVSCGFRNSRGRIMFGGYPMTFFANGLANEVARAVVDRTGLAGNWDFELTYTRDSVRRPDVTEPAPANADPDGASLFTALQEQLGLKLESTTGPVRVLVIDRIEQPSPD
jgi:bla regulator protein blaR1